ncbi:metal-dependent hydrolase [uncultured Methanoregula sp.]|uniref:metal-dependent hydrolase n=1 Tax=uncultured Methanoregula sp. TaxID=1005933 RepID=UPI002AAA9C70|nr:metal-dependent hydrolase [uncultured Methanoregula sp.]
MFIFAHVFSGALIGTGFFYLTGDRRAFPLCIFGAILPDLLDKPLALLLSDYLGAGRTLGHTLLFFSILFALGIFLWYYRDSLLGMAFAFAVFSHQILDAMWLLSQTWLYPLMGPFPGMILPDYIWRNFWLELSCPSEWVFGISVLIIAGMVYMGGTGVRKMAPVRLPAALLLGVMGGYLLFSGFTALSQAFPAPTYSPETNVMAGLLALVGTIILLAWPLSDRSPAISREPDSPE